MVKFESEKVMALELDTKDEKAEIDMKYKRKMGIIYMNLYCIFLVVYQGLAKIGTNNGI